MRAIGSNTNTFSDTDSMHGQMFADAKAASDSGAAPLIISPKVRQLSTMCASAVLLEQ